MAVPIRINTRNLRPLSMRQLTNGIKDPHDPMWKRVAKDRARRKAAKRQRR